MKKLWILVVLVLVAVFGSRVWYLNKNKVDDKNVVKVGVLSFLSGQYAKMGQDMTNGIILAMDEINNSSEYNRVKIQLIIEDGKGTPKDSQNAFNKILFHQVQALIATGDNQVPPIAPIIIQKQLPTILTMCYNNEPMKFNHPNKYMYKNSYPLAKFSEWFGEYAVTALNLKTVSIIPVKTFFGQESANNFKKGFEGKGGIIRSIEYYSTGEMDIKSQVLKSISSNPDAVFITGYGQEFVSCINYLKELKYKGIILTDSSVTNPENIKTIKSIKDIIFFKQPSLTQTKYEESKKFQQAYIKRFNEKPSDYSGFGYSSMKLLAQAIKDSDLTSAGIKVNMDKISAFDTVFGKLKLYPDGTCTLPFIIGKMKSDGTYEVLKEQE